MEEEGASCSTPDDSVFCEPDSVCTATLAAGGANEYSPQFSWLSSVRGLRDTVMC